MCKGIDTGYCLYYGSLERLEENNHHFECAYTVRKTWQDDVQHLLISANSIVFITLSAPVFALATFSNMLDANDASSLLCISYIIWLPYLPLISINDATFKHVQKHS